MKRFLWLACAGMTACGGAAATESPAPRGTVLAHTLPTPAAATYSFSDSSTFNVQGGAIGNINATIGATGIANITFTAAGDSTRATIRLPEFAGSMKNSAAGGGGPSATEKDITGAAEIAIARNGGVRVIATPGLSRAAEQVGISKSFYHRFSIRLPGRAVQPGATWVDTLTIADETGGTKAVIRDIQTSTFVADTTIAGRRVLLIRISADRSLDISGTTEGVQIAQKLTGTSTGRALWDPQSKLLIERAETSQLSGTFDLPQMGLTGMPVTARSRAELRLQ